uniref:Transforming acidic coiled-coil-containing protein C-terminal domain-containing protein n=1 Tax=Callorhinchus milii TaxID=7868 RepID=A0A4W3GQU5_CALMI
SKRCSVGSEKTLNIDVLHPKNEEVLKKCAQDYLARVKQEEARYQALKLHAEEKLDKANEEIAQVRGKASAEGAAMQASLRKEQMKVDSLDRTIQQKVKRLRGQGSFNALFSARPHTNTSYSYDTMLYHWPCSPLLES